MCIQINPYADLQDTAQRFQITDSPNRAVLTMPNFKSAKKILQQNKKNPTPEPLWRIF